MLHAKTTNDKFDERNKRKVRIVRSYVTNKNKTYRDESDDDNDAK